MTNKKFMKKYNLTDYDVKVGKKYLSALGQMSCMALGRADLPENPEKVLPENEKLTTQECVDAQKFMGALWCEALKPITTAEYIKNMDNFSAALTGFDPAKNYLKNADGTFTEIDPSKNYLYDNGKVKELV